MSTALQVIFLIFGALLIGAYRKPNPRQKYQKYLGSILLVVGIITLLK
ncbi:hypothetical protein [Leuconostoc gelidum]|mgnify:CR=1|uniref:Uncharacterized protein n=1 Tax=Leuconostoc gelidum subsp. gelidum TaxID=1607839 RepID=A0AB35FYD4_LEUGE|nr:hypothetical protein [Leuconostoc gelidum]AFS40921.1 hypothetical protein C269_07420 [Leuconostoc gelidum JB7]MBZ5964155.1 hypothetical protein [Leuconostoc gelidum subsp. gelidum]MBZ5975804.1 hypothetical protein [Leuconostoc gelidum subsp. gelidum]MBZ5976717.1 hypothetical protein [Leuconostoc gelidum subsp. gelidum]MBZ5986115.1 hypothetical protein [Leuconostoc gelidum subsp. gelidum]